MPSYGQAVTLQYVAWDNGNNVGKTGDVGNHTLRWIKDGASAAPSNSPTEVDGTNAPGIYKVLLTAAECQCQVGMLCGKSSTSGIAVLPTSVTFENLPTAAPAAAGGLPVIGTGSGQLNPSGGNVGLNLTQTIPTSNTAQTVGDALNAARAQGFGKWVLSGTTLTLYAADGATSVRTFTLDSGSSPTQRV